MANLSPIDIRTTEFTSPSAPSNSTATGAPTSAPTSSQSQPADAAASSSSTSGDPQAKGRHAHVHHRSGKAGGDDSEDLSGWGKAGERFGGMAQAGLGGPDSEAPSTRPAGAGRAASGTSSFVSYSGSEGDEGEQPQQVRQAAQSTPQLNKAEQEQVRRFEEGGSKSYMGGTQRGYMRMLHALAQDDQDSRSSSRSKKPPFARRRTPPSEQLQRPPQAQYTHNGPPIANDDESSSSSDSDDDEREDSSGDDDDSSTAAADPLDGEQNFTAPPERASQSHSLARCPSEQSPSTANISLAAGLPAVPRKGRKGRKGEDLSKSSIFAIHQPIASARRAGGGSAIEEEAERPGMSRSSTAATRASASSDKTVARQERRERLAEKLMEVFGLPEREEVIAEYPCWLFRSILLQGFLYITAGHLCFYAFLQAKEGATIRSGSLSVRGAARRYHKHWFVLKDDVLSWFPSSTDPYFPDGHIDLHYCISVEPSTHNPHHFKVATSDKRWHFSADSEASRDEWVKTIKKVVFRCQNEGESVKIAVPLETVVDVEKSNGLEFAETIRVRVYDADEGYDIDEYWLSYFKDLDGALAKINETLERFRADDTAAMQAPSPVEDTTKKAVADLGETDQVKGTDGERGEGLEEDDGPHRSKSLGERVSSVLSGNGLKRESSRSSKATTSSISRASTRLSVETPRQSSESSRPSSLVVDTKLPPSTGPSAAALPARSNSSTATPVAGSVATLRPSSTVGEDVAAPAETQLPAAITVAPPTAAGVEGDGEAGGPRALGSVEGDPSSSTMSTASAPPANSASSPAVVEPEQRELESAHTYPPQPSPGPAPSEATLQKRGSTLSRVLTPGRKILEVVTHPSLPGRKKKDTQEGDLIAGPVVEEPEDIDDDEGGGTGDEGGGKTTHRGRDMRRTFGMSEKEDLIEYFPAYLFRGLPIYGKVYISTSYFCFKSGVGILNKTKMILPISDIIGVSTHRSYRPGYSGLMVTVKGHEEVFLEMSSVERRDGCLSTLEAQLDIVRQRRKKAGEKEQADADDAHKELQELLDLSASKTSDPALDNPHPKSEAVAGQPPIMFSSTTSDFVTFRPEQPLRFTCLTIGSRGDVQPYIALCKGLMAQGHKCKIASHAEYRKWVEGHGIEFSAVGGDPAELMQLMISHDFFTISFMKEAVGRFRGWLDDLLASAWKGCQDTDVLIESPSAIAGYHIAEALRVPYYRAFTMPWSRTRAYPHAFAVPEVHMGGGYNYMTYTMFDQVFWRATSSQVNRWRKETLKIRPTSLEAMQQHKIPFLYNFSPVVIPPPLDWRENIHVTGYWWLDNPDDSKSKKWEPPEELLKFLDTAKEQDKKVVFIGFGSIIIPDPMEMTRVVAEAVEKADVFAIVAKGWSDRASNKGDSDEQKKEQEDREKLETEIMEKPFIYNVKSIPHDWLFPRIDAAVHHGGAGTTGASLRAGLPTIIKPFFGDQHFYADRVSTLGIGSHVRNFTVEKLTEALTTAVHDEKQIERARLAGEEIRKEDGVATAIECIYRDLEYARSLIPPPSEPSKDSANETADGSDDDDKTEDETAATSATASSKPEKTRSRSPTRKNSSTSSPPNESRTTSSDEGWDVMSRGSAADASQSWDKDSASRASSMSRSKDASVAATHDQREGAEDEPGDGTAETEPQTGLTARMLSMITKGPKALKEKM
ncbi:hypothetical protein JCM10213_000900 [Rhodosporidiobolus nylandii]